MRLTWSATRWLWSLLAALAVSSVLAGLTWLSFPKSPDREWQHVFRVLLRGELQYNAPRIVRWQGEVRIKVDGYPPEDGPFIRELIRDLDQLMVGTDTWLKLGDFAEPEMRVLFVSPDRFTEAMEEHGLPSDEFVEGHIRTWRDEQYRIERVLILIKSFTEREWRWPVVIEEITQALGTMNDSPFLSESQFYDDDLGNISYYRRLPDIDRKLVRFLYLHLKPGDGVDEVRRAYDAHWRTMTVPPRPRAE